MILIDKTEVVGFEPAIRGMRNPMNSWDKSDSGFCCGDKVCSIVEGCDFCCNIPHFLVGPNDLELMTKLVKGGPVHAKFRRMIMVYVDITAPLYWWKEFDTYKVGTVANSCSTMHKIHEREFGLEDFSCGNLISDWVSDDNLEGFLFDEETDGNEVAWSPMNVLELTIKILNVNRNKFIETKNKRYWWQMIQLLPSSYNQKRTIMLNYEVLAGIYPMRKEHKLDEWREFCKWIESLPHGDLITCSAGSLKEDM
jgi:hypothetical protein